MKVTKFFAMLLAFMALSFTAVSCSDDDDDNSNKPPLAGETTAKFTKQTANELELTVSSAIYTIVHNAKFTDKKATEYIITYTCATEEMAEKTYNDLLADKGNNPYKIVRNGNTIIVDTDTQLQGMSYDDMLTVFKSIEAQYKK